MRNIFRVEKRNPLPNHIVPQELRNAIINAKGSDKKRLIAGFLKNLTRGELMDFEDADQFAGDDNTNKWILDAYAGEEWRRRWPIGLYGYYTEIPDIIANSAPIKYLRRVADSNAIDINALEDKVNEIQKRLDRIVLIIENSDFLINGKNIMEM